VSKPRTWVIADDLTGAADSGVAFVGAVGSVRLHLRAEVADSRESLSMIVLDTDSREADSADARRRIDVAVAGISPCDVVFKKVDSLMRGQVAVELCALADALPDRVLVLCPAVPRQKRLVVDGHIQAELADGASLTIGPLEDLITGLRTRHVTGDASLELPLALASARSTGTRCLVVDARTDEELDGIVAAGSAFDSIAWAGAAGLAGAVARSVTAPDRPRRRDVPDVERALVVVGSDTEVGRAQGRVLSESGVLTIALPAAALALGLREELDRMATRVATSLARSSLLVTIDGPVDHASRGRVAASLARVVADALPSADALVVSGGATARSILEHAGVPHLDLVDEIEPGVVLSTARVGDRDLTVVTKSGSFGDGLTLVRLLGALAKKRG